MKRLVLGVVGHVDHGKTALVRALTGMETDRLPEERRRGISIALGFAHAEVGGATVDFVDAPGHEKFVRTLVGGVTGADAVLLVAAADEGVKPQTREHLAIAALLGVREAVIAVSKCDRADREAAWRTGRAALALAAELGLAAAAPIATSAVTGEGLEPLRAEIARLGARQAPPRDDGFGYLPIDRSFLMAGHGLVVTGTLRRGPLRAEDPLVLLPSGRPARVRGLQVHGAGVDVAWPGQRVAVNLRGVEREEAPRGAVLASPGALEPAEWMTVELRAPPGAPPLANGVRLQLLIGAADLGARVRLLDRDMLAPGETALAQLRCAAPVAAPAAEGFVLRTLSPPTTVAGGRVLDPATRRLRRGEPARLRQLERLAAAEGEALIGLVLEDAGMRGVAVERLARLAGLSPARAAAGSVAAGARRVKGDVLVGRASFQKVQARVLRELGGGPAGREALRARAPGLGAEVLDAALDALAAAGRVRIQGGRVALANVDEDRARAEATAALARRLSERLLEAGLSPPDLGPELTTPEARRALGELVRAGEVVRTFDKVQKREVVFHRRSLEGARRRLAERLAPPGLSVGEVGQILGISRKFSVPLLEHLDGVHFTRRQGDRRVLAAGLASDTAEVNGGD